jgi:hypothetical protein
VFTVATIARAESARASSPPRSRRGEGEEIDNRGLLASNELQIFRHNGKIDMPTRDVRASRHNGVRKRERKRARIYEVEANKKDRGTTLRSNRDYV